MKPILLLTIAAIYLILVGLGMLLATNLMMFGTLGANASPSVVTALRGYGGALIGIAVIDFFTRHAPPSLARDAIFLGNSIGFGLVALTNLLGLLNGGLLPVSWVFFGIHLLLAIAFLFVGRANMSTNISES